MARAVSPPTQLRTQTVATKPSKVAPRHGAKVKRYRGRYTHHGEWLGLILPYRPWLSGARPRCDG